VRKNNIIWLLLDGVRNYQTPNDPEKMGKPDVIDEFSKEGVEFLQATTSATSTVMSISAMMAGIPAYYLGRNLEDFRLDKSHFESIGMILQSEGYSVYNVNVSYDFRRDYWKDFLRPVDKRFWPKGLKTMEHWSNEPLNPIIFKMLDERELQEPFFLYVHYNFRRDISCNDRVDELLQRIKQEGLYDDSIIIMNSDHGMPDAERRDYFKWLDERGLYFNRHDLIMTDDNILVPLVMKYPGCEVGQKIDTTVGLIDVAPTILDIIGIEYGKEKKYGAMFRGESLLPLIRGESLDYFQKRKIRTDTRYIAQRDRMSSIRGAGYKYIYYRDIPGNSNEQFFDLSNDVLEENNLISTSDKKYGCRIEEYRKEYERQEEDAVEFQKEFLARKFETSLVKYVNDIRAVKDILVVGSCNYWFLDFLTYACKNAFGDDIVLDLFLERDNPMQFLQLNFLGYRNIVFFSHWFSEKEFKEFKSTTLKYDLVLVLLTDYRKDIQQSESKSNEGKMQALQPQAPISSRLLNDYKEIFKIARLCNAKNRIYLDYNMNFFSKPKAAIYKRYLGKMLAKKDIYFRKPGDLLQDIKRLLSKK